MSIDRRLFIAGAAATAAVPASPASAAGDGPMYGLIGSMTAGPGQRDTLVGLLLDGIGTMPGCLSYIVATDPAQSDRIWITEAWTSKEAHAASLSLPAVRAVIAKARPLIAGMATIAETIPAGGQGMAAG